MKKAKNIWYYIKNYKTNSLFPRMLIFIFAILAIPLITLSTVFYNNLYHTIKEEMILENGAALKRAQNVTDSILNECDLLSSYIGNHDSAQFFTMDTFQGETLGDLTQFTKVLPLIYRYIDSVYVYSESNQLIFDNSTLYGIEKFADNGWLQQYHTLSDRRGCIIAREKKEIFPQLLTFIKPIYITDQKRGAVILNINSQALYSTVMAESEESGQELLLLDKDGQILLSKNSALFQTGIEATGISVDLLKKEKQQSDILEINGIKSVISFNEGSLFGFRYLSVLPMTNYEARRTQLNRQILLAALLLFFFGLLFAYIITLRTFKPLQKIIAFLDASDSEVRDEPENQNELLYIINRIEQHIEDKQKIREILEERVQTLKKSQYNMLQSQINPHFLYNTLETINWMAYDMAGAHNPVSKALVSLSGFFRNTLSSSGYLIPIETEIAYTRDYIKILELRYSDVFEVVWNVDQEILSCTTIKICLQPIIENAVYHGLKPKDERGKILITGKIKNDDVVFTVSDNGVGMEKDAVEKLNQQLRREDYQESPHIGLTNVNQRIKIIFGKEYGIQLTSRPGLGTSITVTFPTIPWKSDFSDSN